MRCTCSAMQTSCSCYATLLFLGLTHVDVAWTPSFSCHTKSAMQHNTRVSYNQSAKLMWLDSRVCSLRVLVNKVVDTYENACLHMFMSITIVHLREVLLTVVQILRKKAEKGRKRKIHSSSYPWGFLISELQKSPNLLQSIPEIDTEAQGSHNRHEHAIQKQPNT